MKGMIGSIGGGDGSSGGIVIITVMMMIKGLQVYSPPNKSIQKGLYNLLLYINEKCSFELLFCSLYTRLCQ
jgi:hypothetical protein